MNITYNNETSGITNLITFNDIPNILKITDTTAGSRATVTLTFNGTLGTAPLPEEGYWYLTINGETIASVQDYANAINKNFYPSRTNAQSTAASVAKALRNCPTIAANFTVQLANNIVYVRARDIGQKDWNIATNIAVTYLNKSTASGSASSPLYGSMVSVGIYKGDVYVTTLEKNYYNGEVAFNLSPVLTTIAKVGETVPYQMQLSYVGKNGDYTLIGTTNVNYIAQGYMCNLGQKFLRLTSNPIFAMNYKRGNPKTTSNNTTLYVYGNSIPISLYTSGTSVSLTITYRNSATEAITSTTQSFSFGGMSVLHDIEIPLVPDTLRISSYVDVTINATNETLRFAVIKPMKATEYYQRVLWRNSYGGISFFDFTGARVETRNLETKTYQKNIYDYYTSEFTEMDKIYDSDVNYEIQLKTHVIDADGRYPLNDLMQTPMAWTVINSQKYAVIIESVAIDEIDRNDIFEGTIKYRYSMKPSII